MGLRGSKIPRGRSHGVCDRHSLYRLAGRRCSSQRSERCAVASRVSKIKYAARFEKYSKAATKVNDVVNRGFAIAPDANSRVVRGIYKITDTPFVGGAARRIWNVTDDPSTGARRVGVGASEIADPGALVSSGVVRAAGGVLRAGHPNIRQDLITQAEGEGVNLIASAKTGDKSIATIEGLAVEAGNQDMIRLVDDMSAQIQSFGERIADEISDVDDALVAGTRLGEGLAKYTDDFIEEKNKLYSQWEDQASA